MDTQDLAGMIDHTLLAPEATQADAEALAQQASKLGAYSICISPSLLPISTPPDLAVATVCGFPSGAHTPEIKASEARQSASLGANEIDMVVNLGLVKAGDYDALTEEIQTVRSAVPSPIILKVIIESAVLTDGEIIAACRASENAGADFVKTSTGFHPAGGASIHAVELMADTVGDRLGVKASGGIRDRATAEAMIAAGATRLGLSASASILAEDSAED